MTSTPRAIGTLIVVILKAKHLPNKRHIGKQSPYCSVSFNGENRRTKAIRKGGQHPEWDEEVRFTVYGADSEDEFEIIAHPDGTAPPPPPKEEKKGPKKVKGGTSMKLFCFADDPREPDLVGETVVDLTEVLTKGETDEWFTLMYKDKYAGEVYLELTFWSNEPAPEKKKSRKPPPSIPQYGGSGSFVPFEEGSITPPNGEERAPSHVVSMSRLNDHLRQPSDSSSTHLRTSASMAHLDLYAPAYESRARGSSMENLTNEFGEFGVQENHRESLPAPPGSQISHRWPQSHSPQSSISSAPYGSTLDRSYHDYKQDAPPTSYRGRSVSPMPFGTLESRPPPSTLHPRRSTRYSLPATSSGFMPLASRPSEPSGFLPQHTGYAPRIPSGFTNTIAPSLHSGTPAPQSFPPMPSSMSTQSGFPQPPTSIPQSYSSQSSLPQPPSAIAQSYSSQSSLHASSSNNSFQSSQSYQYYPTYPSQSAPPSLPPPPPLPISSISPHPPMPSNATPSPPRERTTPPGSVVSAGGTSSRPLPPQPIPQSQVQIPQQGQNFVHGYASPSSRLDNVPPASGYQQHHYNSVNGQSPLSSRPMPTTSSFQSIPPPPPPPLQPQYTQEDVTHPSYHPEPHHSHSMDEIYHSPGIPPPPPPASTRYPSRRQSSLPQPPVNQGQYHRVSNAYQSIPPPPPPPTEYQQNSGNSFPEPSVSMMQQPGPPFPPGHQVGQFDDRYQEQYDHNVSWVTHTNNNSPIHQAAWS